MAPKYHDIQCRLFIIALLAIWVGQTHGQTPTTTSNYFAPTQDLTRPVPSTLNNQNFTRCCLRAVEQWHKDPTGQKDIYVENNISPYNIFANPDDLGKANKQFPCGAAYSDDRDDAKDGAPQVKVSYQWCTANCGGWQRSRSAVLEQWVQPFVGFILPAAVFCLNVRIYSPIKTPLLGFGLTSPLGP